MHFQLLTVLVLFFSTNTFAEGRKPAVEDFIGIEIENPETNPQNAGPLFNLEQDLSQIEHADKNPSKYKAPSTPVEKPWSSSTLFAIGFVLALPVFTLMIVLTHLRNKAGQESSSNVQVLEKYRKERELAKKKSEVKKVA